MKLLFQPNRLHKGVLAIWLLSLVLVAPQLLTQYALAQQNPALVDGVDAIGITVSDMDRAVDFYSKVLTFEKVSDTEVAGESYEHLEGVFGLRMRVVRMRLGDEFIELTEYLAPKGRPIPVDSRSNDRWFQHIAINNGGRQAEQYSRQRRSCERDQQYMTVEPNFLRARQRLRQQAQSGPHPPEGQQQAKTPAPQREQCAFRQELPHHTPLVCAEGRANGEFMVAGRGASQKQIRHIHTGDEEHKTDRGQQQQEKRPNVPHQVLLQR